jgi:2'-5' RNA ligase
MRLFVAIVLPADLQRRLAKLKDRLAWLPVRGVWPAAENLHLTLKFLGNVADDAVKPLCDAIASCQRPALPLLLRPDRLVLFPPGGPARVLGVGFSGDTEKGCQLQQQLEIVCQEAGFPLEARAFTPHATLARFRDGVQMRHLPRITGEFESLMPLPEFACTQFQLMQSELTHRGSQYTPAASFAFA